MYSKTCGYEDTKLAAVFATKADADANTFRKGMQSHDKDNEHDATEIRAGEVADVIFLVLLQESFCAHNK